VENGFPDFFAPWRLRGFALKKDGPYLRLTGLKPGLVINFGERFVQNGIHRVVNGLFDMGLPELAPPILVARRAGVPDRLSLTP
jgi:hypothetical protein